MSQTPQKRVAIISKQEDIVSFFELEAISCGCSVEVLTIPPTDLYGYDRVVIDARVGYCMSGDSSCKVVTLFTDEMKKEDVNIGPYWEWPVDIGKVRSFFEGRSNAEAELSNPPQPDRTSDEPMIYILSEKNRTVLYRNRQIGLTDRGWRLLLFLASGNGEPIGRERLFELFQTREGNIVDVYIHHLRKKLEEPFGIRLIHTVRNKGYRLSARVKRLEQIGEE